MSDRRDSDGGKARRLWGRPRDFLLMNAAAMGKSGTLRTLLRWGADPNARDHSFSSAHFTDEAGKMHAEAPYQRLTTVLQVARTAEVVRALVEHGADVDATDADGWTALMTAVLVNNVEVVQALLAAGATVDKRDRTGRTALEWAELQGNEETARLLADAKQ